MEPTHEIQLPSPFKWIEIPGSRGTMQTNHHAIELAIPTQRYWIAKYPITNTQFMQFIHANGYNTEEWWTAAGWQQRTHYDWTEPRFWQDDTWNLADHPVVGVSWYEAIAYCRWLDNQSMEPRPVASGHCRIVLPTEQQWQYAAQGADGRHYPWGNQWNSAMCNNNVNRQGVEKTTPVTQFKGKSDSPFGVIDMAGNAWEWCLTEYSSGNNRVDGVEARVIRGGGWLNNEPDDFYCAERVKMDPTQRTNYRGFRICLA
ncbi:MAG: SUMF1/EgtB/PvdO family nonheme iron enzyme [Chloroflexota bacterium]